MPSTIQATKPLPVYFIGHAGVNLLFDESEKNHIVQDNLRAIGEEILTLSPRPRAIIVFSGHFEAGEIHGPDAIEVNVKQGTYILHDFVNDFHDSNPYVYEYDWPHTDAPELAIEIWKHLRNSGVKAKRVERGVDHGVWVPFKIMFPPENPLHIPVVQVSTYYGYDLESQIRLGEVFKSLRHEGYLIIGSGMAVHSFASIGEIREAETDEEKKVIRDKVLAESRTFDQQLRNAVKGNDAEKRKTALLKLESLHEFKRSHPTVEHFTPLLVAAGAAGDAKAEAVGVDVVDPGMSESKDVGILDLKSVANHTKVRAHSTPTVTQLFEGGSVIGRSIVGLLVEGFMNNVKHVHNKCWHTWELERYCGSMLCILVRRLDVGTVILFCVAEAAEQQVTEARFQPQTVYANTLTFEANS